MTSDTNHRRTEILQVAAKLFAAKGVSATSVREIADRVGILSGSLYHYFSSKDDIVGELMLGWLEDLLGRYDKAGIEALPPREGLEALMFVSLQSIEDYPDATMIYQHETAQLAHALPLGPKINDTAAQVREVWLAVIERGVRDGDFRGDVPSDVFYRLLRDALWSMVTWFDPKASRSSQQLAEDCARVFLDGFAIA